MSARLLGERRFGPLFVTQLLGAFNDNVFKNALVVLFTTTAPTDIALGRDALVNLASGLLILPFFLFSATSGQVADKMEKSRLIRATKLFEIVVMAIAVLALHSGSAILLLSLLFLMGLQSTIFGPVKFSILPQVLRQEELVAGNGLVEMGTYVAILGGTLLGGVLAAQSGWGPHAVGATVIVTAIAGWLASRAIPAVPSATPELVVRLNPIPETWRILGTAHANRAVWLSILGNSWFWGFGALFLAQLPGFNEDVIGGTPGVITLLLALFSLGIGVGSLLCERLSSGHIELGLVPFGSIGLTLFAVDLFFATEWRAASATPLGPLAVLSDPANLRWMIDLVLIGVFGGFYSVPLNAIIQHRSDPTQRSRIIAANNVMNALFIVSAAGIAIFGLHTLEVSIPELFLAAAVGNAVVAVYIFSLLPEFLLRFLVWLLMHTMYRLRTKGAERFPDEGPALLVCNHVSYVDAMILSAACRRPIRFVMWWRLYEMPLLHGVFRTARAIPIGGAREKPGLAEKALAEAARALEEGELVCIFPEGALTYSGKITTFKPGVERILEKQPVPVIPMALRGLWGSWFSRRGGAAMKKRPRRFRSQIELAVGEAIAPDAATAPRLEALVAELRGDMA